MRTRYVTLFAAAALAANDPILLNYKTPSSLIINEDNDNFSSLTTIAIDAYVRM